MCDEVTDLRAVARHALELRGGFEVVAEAADGAGAIAAAAAHRPDVVVLDLGLPDLAGSEVVRRLRQVAPQTAVVVYTGSVTADRSEVTGEVEAFVRKDQGVRYLVDLLGELGRLRPAAAVQLGPHVGEVAAARRFLTERCERWGCEDLVDDGTLVLTELVTNALMHAGSGCRVAASFHGGVLRLEVTDRGGGVPDVQAPGRLSEHGRGLLLVSILSAAWGVDTTPGGKTVWAELTGSPADGGLARQR